MQFYERCDICKKKTNDFITYKKSEDDTPHIICRECAQNIAESVSSQMSELMRILLKK